VPYIPDLFQLLTPGHSVESDGVTFVLEPHDLGDVVMPTGEVVGCDPLVSRDTPFTVTVPPGTYPLRAWVAVMHRDGAEWQRRIAALQLVVDDAPAVTWTMALTDGQDPSTLGEDEFFGYGVDAGTGTLADRAAIVALDAWDYDDVEDALIPADFPADPVQGVLSAVTDEPTGANVFVVSSGWGDGHYATYTGHAADGRLTSFVTDFAVLP